MADNKLLSVLGILFGIVGVIMHSSKAVIVKLVYEYDVDTLELLLFRMLFSAPFYVLILVFSQGQLVKEAIGKTDYVWLFLFGFLGYYLASYFDFLGLNFLKAGLERIILFIYPTIVVFLSWVVFKIKITKVQTIAIAITYLGVLVTFWSEVEISGDKTLLGAFWILLCAITYAAYLVGSGWLIPKFGTLRFTCYAMLASTICVMVHYTIVGDWDLFHFPLAVYGYILLMSVVATIVPSFLVSESIKRLGASNFSILGSIGPVTTILLAYIFIDERLSAIQLFGMAIVIFGVTYLSLKGKKA